MSGGEKRRIQLELEIRNERWETDRGENLVRSKRPWLDSQDWADIQLGAKIDWECRQQLKKAERRNCMGGGECKTSVSSPTTGAPQQRGDRGNREDGDIPTAPEVLPE